MNILLHPTYFPSIASFVAIANANQTTFEICDNYQKQTYRNRMYIYAANGKLALTIPVIYTQKNRQLYRDIKISNDSNWQDLHWKSIHSSYRGSPFFEFYEDEFRLLFTRKHEFLLDFNMNCMEAIYEALQLPYEINQSEAYETLAIDQTDYRILVNNRKEIQQDFQAYVQVFDDKQGFISNLSILDLICNEGPNAMMYLEAQALKF